MLQKKYFNLKLISQYRNQLFGIAIISIILFHFSEDFNNAVQNSIIHLNQFSPKNLLVLAYYNYIRSIGVEIFVFLSGMGLYYSFSTNNNIIQFYKRRFQRIFVPYIIVAGVFWAIKDFYFHNSGIKAYISDLSFYTFFTKGTSTIWFIGLMFFLYILFPLIYKIACNKFHTILLITFTCFFSIFLYHYMPDIYHNISIASTRVPLFLLGVYTSKHIKNEVNISIFALSIFCIIGLFTKFLRVNLNFPDYMDRFMDSIYACALILIFTILIHVIIKLKFINIFLIFIGNYSLELYMVHVTMRNLMKECELPTYRISYYFGMIIISIFIAILLNRLSHLIKETLFSKHN